MDDFEQYRALVFSVAYQMLGSAMEAEDIVQETYLRSQKAKDIESPKAYLTTIATRLCLNQINSSRARREEYIGPWLPEPLLDATSPLIPGAQLEQKETISIAFLVLLEVLTPPERAVFLLRKVFDYEYAEIGQILEREEADCRQLYSRAKKHLAENRPRFSSSPEQHRQMLERFLQAVQGGQVDALTTMLAQDAVLWADGVGRPGAATRPVIGSDAIARFVQGAQRYLLEKYRASIEQVNGEAALVIRIDGKAFLVLLIEVAEGRIQTIRAIGNPEKLTHL